MANNDYGQLFCEAVDTIVQQRLSQMNFDVTKICVIINDNEASNGKYRVKVIDGLSEFEAYSTDLNFKNNDVVYVSIPVNDMNEQKFILGKKIDDANTPLSYKPPFDSFINITGNLISNTEALKTGLIANEKKSNEKDWAEEKIIWAYNNDKYSNVDFGESLSQYSTLGIQGQFRSWLNELEVISGSYGLKLRVEAEKEDLTDIENDKPEDQILNNNYLYTWNRSTERFEVLSSGSSKNIVLNATIDLDRELDRFNIKIGAANQYLSNKICKNANSIKTL